MKVLYITKHNPWGRGGGSVASKMYLYALCQLFKDAEIDLCISSQIATTEIPTVFFNLKNLNIRFVKSRTFFNKILSPITGITHRYQKIGKDLIADGNYTYYVFDHSSVAGTLIKIVPKNSVSIVIHHNFEPSYFADNTKSSIYKHLLLPSVRRAEKKAYKSCSLNLFLTEEDLNQFSKIYGKTNAINFVSGLFEFNSLTDVRPVETLQRDIPTIVITGSLNNVQNIDGIRYFSEQLYPLIPKNYKIIIAGQNPTEEIYLLINDKDNITIIPNPEDMNEIVRRGNIFLSPARVGGGIKVRITDGLRLGLPIIAHNISARGYGMFIKKGYFKPFDSPQDFKLKLDQLITEINNKTYTSQDISNYYKKSFSLENIVSELKDIIFKR